MVLLVLKQAQLRRRTEGLLIFPATFGKKIIPVDLDYRKVCLTLSGIERGVENSLPPSILNKQIFHQSCTVEANISCLK